ncbi:phosphoglycolate phosphatase [Meridianimarinicoccus aquatilis]|uniref:Phosphoglycolate phosphatase n=1 Tax=Meridianimarinicoccus aquatilis TaxID=2552766 RepID=A0A4R6B4K0_9RHOB|nr:phosphoglycolate phosphatase [Fluviibacterium aquatile]TDL91364.1 phosphoglycolate phosphatase [Fluviibacterium aquatile]
MSGAVVFDLDGTLIDSAPDLHAAGSQMLTEFGAAPVTPAQTRSFIGNGVPTLVERLMGAAGLGSDPSQHAACLAAFTRHYEASPTANTTIYPGVLAALDDLEAAGWTLGICTNKPEGPAVTILRAFGLLDQMKVVVGGDTLPVKKPDPAPLFHAFDALPDGPRLYVGDSEVDAGTAQAAGIRFALYSEGYRKTPVADIPHDHAFADFAALPAIAALAR